MISTELANLADRLAGYSLRRRAMEPEVACALASVLAHLAERTALLEALPFVALEDKR